MLISNCNSYGQIPVKFNTTLYFNLTLMSLHFFPFSANTDKALFQGCQFGKERIYLTV